LRSRERFPVERRRLNASFARALASQAVAVGARKTGRGQLKLCASERGNDFAAPPAAFTFEIDLLAAFLLRREAASGLRRRTLRAEQRSGRRQADDNQQGQLNTENAGLHALASDGKINAVGQPLNPSLSFRRAIL
jgi:hypothetical protein